MRTIDGKQTLNGGRTEDGPVCLFTVAAAEAWVTHVLIVKELDRFLMVEYQWIRTKEYLGEKGHAQSVPLLQFP